MRFSSREIRSKHARCSPAGAIAHTPRSRCEPHCRRAAYCYSTPGFCFQDVKLQQRQKLRFGNSGLESEGINPHCYNIEQPYGTHLVARGSGPAGGSGGPTRPRTRGAVSCIHCLGHRLWPRYLIYTQLHARQALSRASKRNREQQPLNTQQVSDTKASFLTPAAQHSALPHTYNSVYWRRKRSRCAPACRRVGQPEGCSYPPPHPHSKPRCECLRHGSGPRGRGGRQTAPQKTNPAPHRGSGRWVLIAQLHWAP